jgi:GT2 family glycosyltransferase
MHTQDKIKISIIIVSYNSRIMLSETAGSIMKHCKPIFEIIIIDNDSKDGSPGYIDSIYGRQVKIVKNAENKGFGAANNQGAKLAVGNILFFLNSDVIVESDIASLISGFLESREDYGIASPRLVMPDRKNQPFGFGRFPTPINIFYYKFLNKFNGYKKDQIIRADWVSGAALAIRKDIFMKIGGFDENFFMYYEDIDLCKRTADLGFKAAVLNNSKLIHIGGGSSRESDSVKKYYFDSQKYYFQKYFNNWEFFLKFFRFLYSTIRY